MFFNSLFDDDFPEDRAAYWSLRAYFCGQSWFFLVLAYLSISAVILYILSFSSTSQIALTQYRFSKARDMPTKIVNT